MAAIEDHPLRYPLANELHARPFPSVEPPAFAVFLAIKSPKDAAGRDRSVDREHLLELLNRYGVAHPQKDANHYFGELGRYRLKWEQHTEFVTYTLFGDQSDIRPFDPTLFDVFPDDWLKTAPGVRLTSALFQITVGDDTAKISDQVSDWFVPESVAVSHVLDASAVVAGDFRIDLAGHMRFAVFAKEDTGPRRIGRIVQRLCEIETYKAMSMLGLQRARETSAEIAPIDAELSALVETMNERLHDPSGALKSLLSISAKLEHLSARSSYRFAGTAAYAAIVSERIDVLRETHFSGRQTFREFMTRRFEPAMRTVKSTEQRLASVSERAIRAGDLLRTMVDVDRSAQNQALLESMDKRADLQLRLQQTVEGLSVVAISYYAVNLASYLAYPVVEALEISKGTLTAALTIPVVLLVWFMVRRIKKGMGH